VLVRSEPRRSRCHPHPPGPISDLRPNRDLSPARAAARARCLATDDGDAKAPGLAATTTSLRQGPWRGEPVAVSFLRYKGGFIGPERSPCGDGQDMDLEE
jgi:hypothetical protein